MALLYLDADVDTKLGRTLGLLGHDVLTPDEVGRRRAGDEEQLAYAAALGRIFVRHNKKDFLLLQRAWRHWSDLWAVEPRPPHFGILVPLQPPHQTLPEATSAIDAFVRSDEVLTSRFFEWKLGRGWMRNG
ncbi:MAG: DUF5615 family PIN-like protein [Thermomicrobiales bacterium]